MTAIDVIIIVFAAFFGLVGFSRGFVIGALSLIGFAGGAYLGTRFGPHLLKEGNASPFAPLLGLIGALIGGVVLSAVRREHRRRPAVGHPLAGLRRCSTGCWAARWRSRSRSASPGWSA